ncbi:MAG TPA: DUF952 domain-containing protein [Planctomycetes bacterium]|nr:DUF952 domain-containing protein [Planctomycetota bacterium]
MILHIVSRAEWEAAQGAGRYAPASLEREGFIHFSTPGQVLGSAGRYYAGRDDLLLLQVDPAACGADLRWEDPGAGPTAGQEFPHLYRPLGLGEVLAVHELPLSPEGFVLPNF